MKLPLLLPSNFSASTTPSLTLPLHFPSSTLISPRNSTFSLNSPPFTSFNRNFFTLSSSNYSPDFRVYSSLITDNQNHLDNHDQFVEIKNPNFPLFVSSLRSKFSLTQQAFFLLTFIASTTCVAFISLVAAAVPTLYAMGRAANSFAKLADTASEELPSTMAAIRLSGMEISDLTVELSDLSQEISEGINKSAEAIQAAKRGVQQIGSLAQEQTKSMIEERASLPVISLQPVVSGAAKKTSRAVGHATRTLMNFISGAQLTSEEN